MADVSDEQRRMASLGEHLKCLCLKLGARKRLEHRYKSLRYASEREGISVTDPAKYAERFQRFLFDKFVTLGDDFVPATAPAAAPAEAPAPVPEEPPEQAEAPAPA